MIVSEIIPKLENPPGNGFPSQHCLANPFELASRSTKVWTVMD